MSKLRHGYRGAVNSGFCCRLNESRVESDIPTRFYLCQGRVCHLFFGQHMEGLGLIQFRRRFSYAADVLILRSNSAGLIWPSVECRRRWL